MSFKMKTYHTRDNSPTKCFTFKTKTYTQNFNLENRNYLFWVMQIFIF